MHRSQGLRHGHLVELESGVGVGCIYFANKYMHQDNVLADLFAI